jgi:hypothetical protein
VVERCMIELEGCMMVVVVVVERCMIELEGCMMVVVVVVERCMIVNKKAVIDMSLPLRTR